MRSPVVSALVAALLLAAVFVCPCPAMAAERHGCCADETTSIAPASCCGSAATSTSSTPRVFAPAPSVVSLAGTVMAAPALSSSTSAPAAAASPLPLSPPRVLRI